MAFDPKSCFLICRWIVSPDVQNPSKNLDHFLQSPLGFSASWWWNPNFGMVKKQVNSHETSHVWVVKPEKTMVNSPMFDAENHENKSPFWSLSKSSTPCKISLKHRESLSGWWFQLTPLKNDGVKVSWDDVPFPTEWNVIQNSMVPVSTNQL